MSSEPSMTEPTTDKDETAGAVEIDEETDSETSAETGDEGPVDSGDVSEGSSDAPEGTDDAPGGADRSAERAADPSQGAAGASDGAAGPDDGTELMALREEFEELNDRHLRLAAEFNNFRRRSEQERLSAWSRAQADLVGDLIDVLDDLHRVAELDLGNATVEAIMEGIDLVERKFMRKLEEAGVEVIEPRGEAFDPERMEAMMRVPAEDDDEEDTVAEVFQKGYSLKGILVRPARVSVYTDG